jgi:ribosomal protein S18 acetylase RimI-like enzyme
MIGQPLKGPRSWRKMHRSECNNVETFLREREKYCVSASGRFISMKKKSGRIWYLPGAGDEISAILLSSHRSLYPILGGENQVPVPNFLKRLLGTIPVHSIQGLREDAEILEALIEPFGYEAAERIDYALMCLDRPPQPEALRAGPADLVLRPPLPSDFEFLFELQSMYEQEEVLPKNAPFNPTACRLNLGHIIAFERVLVAEWDGQVVAKINTNAESFTRFQIGGVYVRPDCRGRGIGAKMIAVFAQDLLLNGKGISLFVKKRNNAALKAYHRSGFTTLADYRICYY